jgi:beta-alanine degradation protein BauB
MMPSRTTLLTGALCFVAGGCAMWGRQRLSEPSRREPQFENADMKVWKSIIMPQQPLALHRHEHGRALIALTDGVLKVVDGTGKLLDTYHWEKGKAYWLGVDPPGQTHADVNESDKPVEVIVVELKKDR